MAHKPLFVLYKKENRIDRFRIAPANPFGLVVFLINLGAVLFGCFEMLGMYGYVPQWLGAMIFGIAVGMFLFSMIYLTDFSNPSDQS